MLDPEVRDVIARARDLIADPAHWTQVAQARTARLRVINFGEDLRPNEKGEEYETCPPQSSEAVMWCAEGAVSAMCADTAMFYRAIFPLDEMACALHGRGTGVIYVNDQLGHEPTLAVFDKVLADERIA